MAYEMVECPECGQVNEIEEGSSSFFCAKCGIELEIEDEYEYVYEPPMSIQRAPATTSEEEAGKRLMRAFFFLEDGEWDRAWSYCESVLDYDPENARAYLGELLVALRLRSASDLGNCGINLSQQRHFMRALRFADGELKQELTKYAFENKEAIRAAGTKAEREKAQDLENAAKFESRKRELELEAEREAVYQHAVRMMKGLEDGTLWEASVLFTGLGSYKDSPALAEQCRRKRNAILQ